MSMMMPPEDPAMGLPPSEDMGGGGMPPMAPPPGQDMGGELPPELMAALAGGGSSSDMMAEGPMAGYPPEEADEQSEMGEDPLSLIRSSIAHLRKAGDMAEDDQLSAQIDKIQADLQKILAGEAAKTSQLRSALGG